MFDQLHDNESTQYVTEQSHTRDSGRMAISITFSGVSRAIGFVKDFKKPLMPP